MLLIVVPLGIVAALLYAVSDFLEQRAARNAATRDNEQRRDSRGSKGDDAGVRESLAVGVHHMIDTFRRMVHDRRWFIGWAAGTLAYFVQAAALHLGSVAVVQALQVTTLLFAIPLSALGRPETPSATDWLAGAAICVGLSAVLVGRGAPPTHADADRGRIAMLLVLVAVTVAALILVSALRKGFVRAVCLALAAGTAFASSATLVKLTTAELVASGVAGTATDWPGYCLAVATGAGLVLQQAAFASGRLATATTAMVVANPVVGTVIAIIGFREGLSRSPVRLVAIAGGAMLVVTGVGALARSPLLRDRGGPEPAASPA